MGQQGSLDFVLKSWTLLVVSEVSIETATFGGSKKKRNPWTAAADYRMCKPVLLETITLLAMKCTIHTPKGTHFVQDRSTQYDECPSN